MLDLDRMLPNIFPTKERHGNTAGLMLAHRLQRWLNIKSTVGQHILFAGLLGPASQTID